MAFDPILAVKWLAFRLFESFSLWRNPQPALTLAPAPSNEPGKRFVWVFVSTIGELNAVDHWLRELLTRLDGPDLILLTDRSTYTEAYQRKYPAATVAHFTGATDQADRLAQDCPPRLLVIAEIPCMLHDAPCRFSYATLLAARRSGAPVLLVNGWLYGDKPPSRLDRLENKLFRRDYLRALDLALVQTTEVRDAIVMAGADPNRVHVTGNLKFDAMRRQSERQPQSALAQELLAHRAGPIVVAGSVTETVDQKGLLEAFAELQRHQPGARMVLAPRHPENSERMSALADLLARFGLAHQYRSRTSTAQALVQPVLILDTMGELGECYASSTFAYVGTDHNVLEPLAYSRLVYVSGEWHKGYPSYPIYQQTLALGLIAHVGDLQDLGAKWILATNSLDSFHIAQRSRVSALFRSDQGRIDKTNDIIFQQIGNTIERAM